MFFIPQLLPTLEFFRSISSTVPFCGGMDILMAPTGKAFCELKKKMMEHLTGCAVSGKYHLEAMKHDLEEVKHTNRCMEVQQGLLKICLEVVKQKSAALHYEQQVALVASMGVDVGTIEHSRSVQFHSVN